jgi:transposase InsO family protein
MVAHRESATLAERLIDETCRRQDIHPDRLTIHADRGSSMVSKSVAFLLADLGVTKTHSRPHVSEDNLFSEAHFNRHVQVCSPGRSGRDVDVLYGSSVRPCSTSPATSFDGSVPRAPII